jgi:hypothetical protein
VAQFTGSCVFGDSLSGKLFYGNPNIGTEAGVQVLRQFTLPPIWGGTHRAFCSRLEVEMEVGGEASPQECYLTWSDNGGRTITSSTRTLHTGIGTSEAALRARPFTTRLGRFARAYSPCPPPAATAASHSTQSTPTSSRAAAGGAEPTSQ